MFILYDGLKGSGFIGIEIKYAETLMDDSARYRNRYKEVALASGKFTTEGLVELCKMPVSLEQIWRDHLLSLSMLPPVNHDFEEGFFVYLFPRGNEECINSLNRYQKMLNFKNPIDTGLHILQMEDLVEAIKAESDESWIRDFEDRYLNFDKIEARLEQ